MKNQEEKEITVLFKKLENAKIITVADKSDADLIIEIDKTTKGIIKSCEKTANRTFIDIEPLELIIFRITRNYDILSSNSIKPLSRLNGKISYSEVEGLYIKQDEYEYSNGKTIEILNLGTIDIKSFEISHVKDCLISIITK